MKILTNIMVMLLLSARLFAQEEDLQQQEQDPKVKQKIQAARVAYITDQLALTPEEAEKFWPIYREFSEKRQHLLKEYHQTKRNPDQIKKILYPAPQVVSRRISEPGRYSFVSNSLCCQSTDIYVSAVEDWRLVM